MTPKLISWDLGPSDHRSDDMIETDKNFTVCLNMYICYDEHKSPDMFSVRICSPEFLTMSGWNFEQYVIVSKKNFFPKQIVCVIETFLSKIDDNCADGLLSKLRRLFLWEYEDNLSYELAKALRKKSDDAV